MDTIPTDFHRPDFAVEYENYEHEKPIVAPEAVVCCACTPNNTSICATENDSAHFLGAGLGYIGAFWSM